MKNFRNCYNYLFFTQILTLVFTLSFIIYSNKMFTISFGSGRRKKGRYECDREFKLLQMQDFYYKCVFIE